MRIRDNIIIDGLIVSNDLTVNGNLVNSVITDLQTNKADITYVDTEISNAVFGLLDDRGNYDASSNMFPVTGGSGTGSAVTKGDLWIISATGTLGTASVGVGDVIRSLYDDPGQTESNWAITINNIGYVSENSANKDIDNTLSSYSDIKYPSQKAVKDYVDNSQVNIKNGSFGVGFYKGVSTITAGEFATLIIPYNGVITGWQIIEASDSPVASNIVIDVWKDNYTNYPPNISDSIAGTEKPTLSTSTKNQDLSLTTWNATFSAGDIFKFKVESASIAKNVLLNIYYTKL